MRNYNTRSSVRHSSFYALQQAAFPSAPASVSVQSRPPVSTAAPADSKSITLRTLIQLKRLLYAQAARAQQSSSSPQQAQAIQRRVDAEARHIAFVINMAAHKL